MRLSVGKQVIELRTRDRYQVVMFDSEGVYLKRLAYKPSFDPARGGMEWRIEDINGKPVPWLRKNFEVCFVEVT